MLTLHDVSNIWRVPLIMMDQNVHKSLMEHLGLPASQADKLDLAHWQSTLADRWDSLSEVVRIAMVGKYTGVCPCVASTSSLSEKIRLLYFQLNGVEGSSTATMRLPVRCFQESIGRMSCLLSRGSLSSGLSDAYLSVIKALQHACLVTNNKLDILWIEADQLKEATKANSSEVSALQLHRT